jgi:hypothetical protein
MSIVLLECNRGSSIEGRARNRQNLAAWTNTMDPVTLYPGDSVSVHSAYINERGVGGDTISFTGQTLGMSQIEMIDPATGALVTHSFEFADNKATVAVSFYTCADGENMITLPRNYYVDSGGRMTDIVGTPANNGDYINGAATMWYSADTAEWVENGYGSGYKVEIGTQASTDYHPVPVVPTHVTAFDHPPSRPRYDGTRYTVMRRQDPDEQTPLSIDILGAPVLQTYNVFKKAISLEVPTGFSTASSIGESLTRQLHASETKIINKTMYSYPLQADPAHPVRANPTEHTYESEDLESHCYQTFHSANAFSMSKHAFDGYIQFLISNLQGSAPITMDNAAYNGAREYWNNYTYIGVHSPEIFAAGRAMNGSSGWSIKSGYHVAAETGQELVTDLIFSNAHLALIQNLCDAQLASIYTSTPKRYFEELGDPLYTFANGKPRYRWMHCTIQSTTFGDDLLGHKSSTPLWFEAEETGAVKYTKKTIGADTYIVLYTWYPTRTGYPYPFIPLPYAGDEWNSSFGWDWHASAAGSDMVMLTNGCAMPSMITYLQKVVNLMPNANNGYIIPRTMRAQLIEGTNNEFDTSTTAQTYLGADDVAFTFNSSSERFEFKNLHTPRRIRNGPLTGITTVGSEQGESLPPPASLTDPNPDAGQQCWERNPTWFQSIFNPEINLGGKNEVAPHGVPPFNAYSEASRIYWNTNAATPGSPGHEATLQGRGGVVLQRYINDAFVKDAIFDAQSGVFIEDLGVPQEYFEDSLWGKLGFQYSVLHEGKGNRNQRVQDSPTMPLTTNAQINTTQVVGSHTNAYGVPTYTNVDNSHSRVPFITVAHSAQGVEANILHFVSVNTNVLVKTESIAVTASSRPVKLQIPYYTVHSNLILDKHYYGGSEGNLPQPVVGIASKAYSGMDFFYLITDETLNFTVETKRTVTDIVSSIHNPDGTYATVNDACSVIYRIVRAPPVLPNLIPHRAPRPQPK